MQYSKLKFIKLFLNIVNGDLPSGNKPFIIRCLDLLFWRIRNGDWLIYYNMFEFNKVKNNRKQYLSLKKYIKIREKVNNALLSKGYKMNYLILTADKFVTTTLLEGLGIKCVPNEALIINGIVISKDYDYNNSVELYLGSISGVFFFKNVFECSGKGILRLSCNNGLISTDLDNKSFKDIITILSKGIWVVQKNIKQFKFLSDVYPHAVNTLRINTILYKREPTLFLSFQKFATGKSVIDNWDSGSLFVGIDDKKGTLCKYGYYKPKEGDNKKVDRHPESGIIFDGWKIPFYREAVDLCLKAHRFFYGRFIIGWDLIITDNGPLILEANSAPEIYPMQVLFGGLKQQFIEIARSNLG